MFIAILTTNSIPRKHLLFHKVSVSKFCFFDFLFKFDKNYESPYNSLPIGIFQ